MSRAARFLFTTFELGGHVAAPLIVAERLRSLGHEVLIVSDRVNRPMAEARSLPFTTWREAPNRTALGDPSQDLRDWATRWPPEIVRRICEAVVTGPAAAYARDTLQIADEFRPDVIVSNELLMGVMAAAEARRTPLALLAANAWCYPTREDVPPFGPGLALASGPVARLRDRALRAGIARLYNVGLDDLNTARRGLGLDPVRRVLDQLKAVDQVVLGISRTFDFGRDAAPPGFAYAGPLVEAPMWAKGTSPVLPPVVPDRPRVLVSFGTTYQDQRGVIAACIQALSTLPVEGVVTLGPAVGPDGLPEAANVRVLASANHDEVVPTCSAVICHGGHGTVMRPLMSGVPLLCMPMGRDHADNAARLIWHKAGLRLDIGTKHDRIAAAVRRLLLEPSWAVAAQGLGERIARETDGGQKAAAVLLAMSRTATQRDGVPTAILARKSAML